MVLTILKMTDNLTKKQRSKCMSNIRSKWTVAEKTVHSKLKSLKVKHKMHPKLAGNPDILLSDSNKAVFIHGCFWHRCSKCYVEPKSKKEYWLPKIARNVERDKQNSKLLKKAGFKVVKVWEHEIKKDCSTIIRKLLKV